MSAAVQAVGVATGADAAVAHAATCEEARVVGDCVVCMDSPRGCRLRPCFHFIMCYDCAFQVGWCGVCVARVVYVLSCDVCCCVVYVLPVWCMCVSWTLTSQFVCFPCWFSKDDGAPRAMSELSITDQTLGGRRFRPQFHSQLSSSTRTPIANSQ
jgi:hypothetical protein